MLLRHSNRLARYSRMRILDVDQISSAEGAELTGHLIAGEIVHVAFRSEGAAILFTDRRILVTRREVLLAEKVETSSFPYRAVQHFSIQESADGASRAAVRIWLGAEPQPLHLRANPGTDLLALQRLLAGNLS